MAVKRGWLRLRPRERRARCPRCSGVSYGMVRQTPDGWPVFGCQRCRATWTDGPDGGIYSRAVETPR